MNELNGVADFIQRVGFPVFVACYLLMGLHPTLRRVQRSLDFISARLTLKGIPSFSPPNGDTSKTPS